MIKVSLCWNQVVRWLRRDITKIIILCIVCEIIFQNEQKYSCRGPELIMLGPQDTRLVPWLIMPGHRHFMSRPKLLRWEYGLGAEINMSRSRLIMSGPLPVMPGPEISMSGPRLIMSGPLLVMCGPRDNYVGFLLIMSGPLLVMCGPRDNYVGFLLIMSGALTYYFEASR